MSHARNSKFARWSAEAKALHARGEKVLIEHVAPLRALTQALIKQIEDGARDEQLIAFVRENYVLALLSPAETLRLNRKNRSRISPKRLEEAGIELVAPAISRTKELRWSGL